MKKNAVDILSIAGYVLMVAGLLGLLTNRGLFSPSPIVIAIQIVGLILMIWARATFGWRSFHATASPTQGGLVTTGPYRLLRHPIYASALLIAWTGGLGNMALLNVMFCLLASAGAALRSCCEETLIREQYREYDDYARKTKRFVPFVF